MIWFVLFLTLIGISTVCTLRLVPSEHLRRYAQSRRDRAYWLAAVLWHSIWTVAAIQIAVAPAYPPPVILRIAGAAMMSGGSALVIWARRANPWALPIVVAPERLVTAGPYAFCDHPMYTGVALVACGVFFLLAQTWAFFPTFAYLCLLIRRIHVEEKILSAKFQR